MLPYLQIKLKWDPVHCPAVNLITTVLYFAKYELKKHLLKVADSVGELAERERQREKDERRRSRSRDRQPRRRSSSRDTRWNRDARRKSRSRSG